jgi:tetratricopeptide (TPR) repeat protein
MLDGDFAAASERFAGLVEDETLPGKYFNAMVSDAALLAGDLERAREYALIVDPLLAGDSARRINRQTARNAVKLAYIEQRRGDERAASEILLQALDVVRDLPRLGTYGHGIRDVQIYALLGRREDALGAFREALDEGFRGSLMFDGWPLFADPYLDAIRDDPRFARMISELDDDLAVMRERLLQAEASDDFDSLRAMATRT